MIKICIPKEFIIRKCDDYTSINLHNLKGLTACMDFSDHSGPNELSFISLQIKLIQAFLSQNEFFLLVVHADEVKTG